MPGDGQRQRDQGQEDARADQRTGRVRAANRSAVRPPPRSGRVAATPAQVKCHQPGEDADRGEPADQQHGAHGDPADDAALPRRRCGGVGGGLRQVPGERCDAQRIPRRRCGRLGRSVRRVLPVVSVRRGVLAAGSPARARCTAAESSSQNAGFSNGEFGSAAPCRSDPPGRCRTRAARATHCSAWAPQDSACWPIRVAQSSFQPARLPCRRSHRLVRVCGRPDDDDAADHQRPERQTPGEHGGQRDGCDDGQARRRATGGVDDRPRPSSDSAADTSSPSAGSSSQPSTYSRRPNPPKMVRMTKPTRISTGSTPNARPRPPATPAIFRSFADRRGRRVHQSPPGAPGPGVRSCCALLMHSACSWPVPPHHPGSPWFVDPG